jgi:four helix bundle protein
LNHLGIARGSLAEIQTQIILARRLGFAEDTTETHELSVRVFRLLNALILKLKAKV